MFRPLTDYETFTIKTAKEKANLAIKAQRKELTKKITEVRKAKDTRLFMVSALNSALKNMEWQKKSLGAIKGLPVRIVVDGQSIVLNYTLLKQIEKRIPRDWNVSFKMEDEYGKPKLIIDFRKTFTPSKGSYELFELPDYQVKLLGELPVIDLSEEEDKAV
jgi:hypothetical protein